MTAEGWVGDYSWARPSPRSLADAGCIGVVRYLGPGNGGRDLSKAEMSALHAAGLGVGVVWETTTTAALAGFKAGMGDIEAANRWADANDVPEHLPIFVAVDTDVTPDQVRGPVADTFHGALQRSGRPVRPYGEADVLDILCGELGLMPCGWQCMAWSRGRLSALRCLYQLYPPVMGGQVDKNELGPMPTDFLWHPDIAFAAPLEHGDALDMADPKDIIDPIANKLDLQFAKLGLDLADLIERAVQRIIAADTQNTENAAAVTRGEAGDIRAQVMSGLGEVLHNLQAAGDLPAEVDLSAVAAKVAQRLTIEPKP